MSLYKDGPFKPYHGEECLYHWCRFAAGRSQLYLLFFLCDGRSSCSEDDCKLGTCGTPRPRDFRGRAGD